VQALFVKLWVGLATLIPALIGVLLIVNPSSAIAMSGLSTNDLIFGVGARNLIYGIITLLAIFYFSRSVVGLMLIGRGLTEMFDTFGTIVSGGPIGPNSIFPFVSGIVTFVVAYALIKGPDSSKRLFSS